MFGIGSDLPVPHCHFCGDSEFRGDDVVFFAVDNILTVVFPLSSLTTSLQGPHSDPSARRIDYAPLLNFNLYTRLPP